MTIKAVCGLLIIVAVASAAYCYEPNRQPTTVSGKVGCWNTGQWDELTR
jgi:hypothetical protein